MECACAGHVHAGRRGFSCKSDLHSKKLSRKERDETRWAERVTFRLAENFKGLDLPSVEMMNRGWETACGVHLKKGQTWAIYANYDEQDRQWEIVSGGKYDRGEDEEYIKFLRDAGARKLDPKISGQIASAFTVEDNRYTDAEVVVEKESIRRALVTDKDGKFSFPDFRRVPIR